MTHFPVLAESGGGLSAEGEVGAADVWAMSPAELRSAGVAAADGVFAALHRPWRWADSGPVLPRRAASRVMELSHGRAELGLPAIVARQPSRDGSTRLALAFGPDTAEAIHMPRAVRGGRVTLCLSSQVGCAMGCSFCATASMGLRRQLTTGEIVAQVLAVVRELGPREPGALTLVFMGMGEPLHNLRHVARAIELLCHPTGLGLSPRRITVSTAGLVPRIAELGTLRVRPLLAVSLNATTDEVRRELMPVGRRYPLALLSAALERYPWRARERATIEYVLLAGINDSDEDARRLADYCEPFPHQINLIPFNAHRYAAFRAPSSEQLDGFARALLARRRAIVTVRRSRGSDVQGACGQLVRDELSSGSLAGDA